MRNLTNNDISYFKLLQYTALMQNWVWTPAVRLWNNVGFSKTPLNVILTTSNAGENALNVLETSVGRRNIFHLTKVRPPPDYNDHHSLLL